MINLDDEIYYYFVELAKIHNEAMTILREAAIHVQNPYMADKIEKFLTELELKKRDV